MTQLAVYIALVDRAERALADSFRVVAQAQASHPDIYFTCQTLATMSDDHRSRLEPVVARYGEQSEGPGSEPERLHAEAIAAARSGPVGLLQGPAGPAPAGQPGAHLMDRHPAGRERTARRGARGGGQLLRPAKPRVSSPGSRHG